MKQVETSPDDKLFEKNFPIEALTGVCPCVNDAVRVKPFFQKVDIEADAASMLCGHSPPSAAISCKLHALNGEPNLEGAFTAINPDLSRVYLTKAQIRRFCVKHQDLFQGGRRKLAFLFKLTEKNGVCLAEDKKKVLTETSLAELKKPGLTTVKHSNFDNMYTAVASIDQNGLHIGINALHRTVYDEDRQSYWLVVPKQESDQVPKQESDQVPKQESDQVPKQEAN